MANRIETALEIATRLLKSGKTEAEILAEHSDDVMRAALREARASEAVAARAAGNAVDTGRVTRPFNLSPETPRAAAAVAPAATTSSSSAARYAGPARDLNVEGGLFGTTRTQSDGRTVVSGRAEIGADGQQPVPLNQADMGNEEERLKKLAEDAGLPLDDIKALTPKERVDLVMDLRRQQSSNNFGNNGAEPNASSRAAADESSPRMTSMGNNPAANAEKQDARRDAISNALGQALNAKSTESLDDAGLKALKENLFAGQVRTTGERTKIRVNPDDPNDTATRNLTNEEIFDRLVHGFGEKDPITGIRPVLPEKTITDADWDHIKAISLTKRIDDPLFKALGKANPDPNLSDMRLKVGVDAEGKPVDEVGDAFELIRGRTQFHTSPDRGIDTLTMIVDDATSADGFKVVGFRKRAVLESNMALVDPKKDRELLDAFVKDNPGAREMNNFEMAKWLRDPRNQITQGDFTTKIAIPQKLKNPIEGVTDKLNTANTPRKLWAIIPDAETVLSKQDLKDLKKLLSDTGRWDPSRARTIDPETGKALAIEKFDAHLRTPNARLTAGDFASLQSHQALRRPISVWKLPSIAKPLALGIPLALAAPPLKDGFVDPNLGVSTGYYTSKAAFALPELFQIAGATFSDNKDNLSMGADYKVWLSQNNNEFRTKLLKLAQAYSTTGQDMDYQEFIDAHPDYKDAVPADIEAGLNIQKKLIIDPALQNAEAKKAQVGVTEQEGAQADADRAKRASEGAEHGQGLLADGIASNAGATGVVADQNTSADSSIAGGIALIQKFKAMASKGLNSSEITTIQNAFDSAAGIDAALNIKDATEIAKFNNGIKGIRPEAQQIARAEFGVPAP